MEKKKTKPFHIVVIIISVVLLVGAVAVFSSADRSKKDTGGSVNYGEVVVWGTIPGSTELNKSFTEFNRAYEGTVHSTYTYVPIDTFDQTMLEALSNDKGPDVVILPSEWLHRNTPRIAPFPYEPQKGGISQREFKDTYSQAGEIFLYPQGIMALPLVIDPLVMYWNRDLFTNAEVVAPPKYWKDVLTLTPKLTKKKNLDIIQSAIALGEYANVSHAKDILSLMFLQVGNPITRVGSNGTLESTLSQAGPITQAIKFYVDFANPLKSGYSWNRSLPNSEDVFLANDLAMYIDFASLYPTLLAKNPRLNFDLAPVPQTDGQDVVVTYGRIHGLAVMKKGKNVPGGQVFSKLFSSKLHAGNFVKGAGMAPMRRDLLAVPQSDAYLSTLYSAALRAKSWIDPQPVRSSGVFSRMIESVLSGKDEVDSAVSQAHTELFTLITGQ